MTMRKFQHWIESYNLARLLAIAASLIFFGAPANAGVSKAELAAVEAFPLPDAQLPLALSLQGEQGVAKPLQQWLGNTPSVWVLADFTCETLCGPVVSIVSDALAQSGLQPGADFRLFVAGLDPKDTAADAKAMKDAQVAPTAASPVIRFSCAAARKRSRNCQSIWISRGL